MLLELKEGRTVKSVMAVRHAGVTAVESGSTSAIAPPPIKLYLVNDPRVSGIRPGSGN